MRTKDIIFGLMVFSVIVLHSATTMIDLSETVGIPIDNEFSSSFNVINQVTNETDKISLEAQQGQITVADIFQTFAKSSLTGIKLFFAFPLIIYGVLVGLIGLFGLPSWIAAFVVDALLLFIGYKILSMGGRWKL